MICVMLYCVLKFLFQFKVWYLGDSKIKTVPFKEGLIYGQNMGRLHIDYGIQEPY